MISSATLRQWHAYIGLLIAPSVLFFAITGAVQLFSLHEAHGSYRPLSVVKMLSSIHKDQVAKRSEHQPRAQVLAPGADAEAGVDEHEAESTEEDSTATVALKWFFLIVALGLALSTCVGVWIGMTRSRGRAVGWCLLTAGTLVPVGLVLL